MKYQLIIFDWQGTLTDIVNQFSSQFVHVSKMLGLPDVEQEKVNSLMNLNTCQLVQTLFPSADNHKLTSMLEHFNNYRMQHNHDVCLYSGVRELLELLHEKSLFIAIATAASVNTIEAELEFSNLSKVFDAYCTPDHCLCKPAPDMLNQLMAELGCEPSQTIMIGDSQCDFEAACHAGVDFIGIHMTNELLITEILEANHQCVDSISQLLPLLIK